MRSGFKIGSKPANIMGVWSACKLKSIKTKILIFIYFRNFQKFELCGKSAVANSGCTQRDLLITEGADLNAADKYCKTKFSNIIIIENYSKWPSYDKMTIFNGWK